MVRAYRIRVPKLLKRKRAEEELGSEAADYRGHDREEFEDVIETMPGIPVMPPVEGSKKPGVIFILDKAPLEIGKVGNISSKIFVQRQLQDYCPSEQWKT